MSGLPWPWWRRGESVPRTRAIHRTLASFRMTGTIPWRQWASPTWQPQRLVRHGGPPPRAEPPRVPPLHEVWEFEGDPVALAHKWAALAIASLRPGEEDTFEVMESCADCVRSLHDRGAIQPDRFRIVTSRGRPVSCAYAPDPGVVDSVFADTSQPEWWMAVRCVVAGAVAGSGGDAPETVVVGQCDASVAEALTEDGFRAERADE